MAALGVVFLILVGLIAAVFLFDVILLLVWVIVIACILITAILIPDHPSIQMSPNFAVGVVAACLVGLGFVVGRFYGKNVVSDEETTPKLVVVDDPLKRRPPKEPSEKYRWANRT
ncbi:MAG: hypothetical protein AAFQ51_16975, partial [Pseudomonadota bacterium]